MTKSRWGRNGFIPSYSSQSTLIPEGSQTRNSRQKCRDRKWRRGHAYWLVQLALLQHSGLGAAPPTVIWVLPHQSSIQKMPLPTDQSGKSIFSVELHLSKMILACVRLMQKFASIVLFTASILIHNLALICITLFKNVLLLFEVCIDVCVCMWVFEHECRCS